MSRPYNDEHIDDAFREELKDVSIPPAVGRILISLLTQHTSEEHSRRNTTTHLSRFVLYCDETTHRILTVSGRLLVSGALYSLYIYDL